LLLITKANTKCLKSIESTLISEAINADGKTMTQLVKGGVPDGA